MQGRGSKGGGVYCVILTTFAYWKCFAGKCDKLSTTFNNAGICLPACLPLLAASQAYLPLSLLSLTLSLAVSISVSVDDSRLPRTRLQLKCTANCFFVCLLQTNLTKFAKITWAECTHAEISSLKRERGGERERGGRGLCSSIVLWQLRLATWQMENATAKPL